MARSAAPATAEQGIDEPAPRDMARNEFARRLYRLMIAKNWNQSELARKSGLGRDSISTYVAAKVSPSPSNLAKLAKALGVQTEDLYPHALDGVPDNEIPAIELRQSTSNPEKAWLRINRALSFATAAKIIELINQEDLRARGENGQANWGPRADKFEKDE